MSDLPSLAELNSACYRLFHKPFEIYLRNEFVYCKDQLQRIPGLITTDERENINFLKDTTIVRKTPVQIISLYDEGANPWFVNHADMAEVFDCLMQHLNRWAEIISDQLSGRTPPPFNELFLMETYMNEIGSAALKEKKRLEDRARYYGTLSSDSFLDQIVKDFAGDEFDFFSDFGGTTPQHMSNIQPKTQSDLAAAFNRSPYAKR